MGMYADRGGHQADTLLIERPGPCVVCGRRCGLLIDGVLVHIPCFEATTAQERAGHEAQPAPAARATTAPATAEVAGSPPADPSPSSATPASAGEVATSTSAHRARVKAPSRFIGPAVVLDVDVIGLPDGSQAVHPFPITGWGQVADLVGHYGLGQKVTDRHSEAGHVWVTEGMLAQLGHTLEGLSPQPRKRLQEFREASRATPPMLDALAHGWDFGGDKEPSLGRWTWMRRKGEAALIALIPLMPADAYPILTGSPSPGVLAKRLALFADAYGHPLKISPQTTATDYLKSLKWGEHEELFAPSPVLDLGHGSVELDGNWTRKPFEHERGMRYVHGYDRGGSYLAGISGGLPVGVGRPQHVQGQVEVTKKTFGLHLVENLPELGDVRFPHPLLPDAGFIPQGPFWRHSVSLQWALEHGYQPRILESWIWPTVAPVFSTWYTRANQARTQLMTVDDTDHQATLAQLKQVYVRMIGQMASPESRGVMFFAPERRWAILARARVNLLRQAVSIGTKADTWPLAMDNDTIVYASNNPEPVTAWPGEPGKYGRGVGQMHWEGSGLMSEQLPFLDGGQWRGKPQLTKDWNPDGGGER